VKLGGNGGIEGKFDSTKEKTNSKTVSDTVSYHIQQIIIVPPHTSVEVEAIVDKINLVAPFTAKIQITGKADRLGKSGKISKMTNVDDNAILYFLQRENIKDIFVNENLFYINTNGTLRIDGYGFDSIVKTKNIPQKSRGSTTERPVILYQILLTILQIIIY
jgi:hypothetical protein